MTTAFKQTDMVFRFPIDDVTIRVADNKRRVTRPIYIDEWNEINQREFTLDVEDVAWFYVAEGHTIEILLYPGHSFSAVELFLNSSIYAAVLHQRKVLPLHASCFSYHEKNILVCGDSGAGKSSLTVAFCQEGGHFITDDVSPVVIKEGRPLVLSLSDRVKLWDDSLLQLNIEKNDLGKIQDDVEKFYFPIADPSKAVFALHHVFVLQVDAQGDEVRFETVKGAQKLALLRAQIYKSEILQGMPENDIIYFKHLTVLCKALNITKITRPAQIPIMQLMQAVKTFSNY